MSSGQGGEDMWAPAAPSILFIIHQHQEQLEGADTPRCNSLEENYSGSCLLKHNRSQGGLSAVEIPYSFEAPAISKPDEAGF